MVVEDDADGAGWRARYYADKFRILDAGCDVDFDDDGMEVRQRALTLARSPARPLARDAVRPGFRGFRW